MYQRQCVQSAAFETCQQNQASAEAFQQNQTSTEAFQHHQRHHGHHGQGAFQHQLVQSAAAAAHWENQQNIKNMEQNWIPCVAQVVISSFSLLFSAPPFLSNCPHFSSEHTCSSCCVTCLQRSSLHPLPWPLPRAGQARAEPVALQPDQGPAHELCSPWTSQFRDPGVPHWVW